MTEAEIAAYYDTLEKECGINSDHPDEDKYWARELKLRYDDMPAVYQAQVDKMGSDQIRKIFEMLSEQGITSRRYFYPLTNSFECYRNYPTAGTEKTPVAQHLALRVLTLPLYADLALEDVDRICDVILG